MRAIFGLVMLTMLWPITANSHEPIREEDKIPRFSGAIGYKGGLPFYTAFHQQWTTRLLLLKAAGEIPGLKEHLRINDEQADRIGNLELFESVSDALRAELLDENFAIDEEKVDPDFYSFLDNAQRELLDRLALEFDGNSGLVRISVANRLAISDETRRAISARLVRFRKELYLPYFRYCFTAKLPPDHEFRDCEFAGRYLAQLNQSVLATLSRQERSRFERWYSKTSPPRDLIEAIKRKAPLPQGLFSLATQNGVAGAE